MPDSPWPLLALSSARSRAKPPDESGAVDALEKFAALCPDSLDHDALDRIASVGSESLKRKTATAVRTRIAGQSGAQELAAWPDLWQLEFQLAPTAQHDAVRQRIRADLVRLRSLETEADDLRLDSLRQGYALVTDDTGRRWAQEELMRRRPLSRAAAEAAIERWHDENPPPRRDAPAEEQRQHRRRALAASESWIVRWPNFDAAWRPRLSAAMGIPDLPVEQVAALAKGLAAFMERNPDLTLGFTDAPVLPLAARLAESGADLPAAAMLTGRGLRMAAERMESDLQSKMVPAGLDVRSNDQIERWMARRTMVLVHAKSGHPKEALAELDIYRKEVAAHNPADLQALWRGWPGLVDAAIAAKRNDVARDAIARMASALAIESPSTPQQKIRRAMHESGWWEARAKLAAAETRSLDALGFYLRASAAVPADNNPAARENLLALARTLWASLGGSPEGFSAYRTENRDADGSRWLTVGTRMPDSPLIEGLPGKTTFINVWATWCGPCQAELPFVQRIYDSLRDKPGVRVLTLNIDDNPGVIEGYMKQRGFTFPVIAAREYVEGQLKVDGIPRNWIVDSEGVLRLERQAGVSESFVQDVLAQVTRVAQR
jgi:thiol-disulfide isomerase/thioredoxin